MADYRNEPPPDYSEVITEQHTSNIKQSYSADKTQGGGCKKCCMSTKRCLMSPECGRCLSIANVIAMCGMCIRMFV